jgi:hypothetical protein
MQLYIARCYDGTRICYTFVLYLRVGQLELTLKQTYEEDMIYAAQRFVNCLRRGGCDRRTDHEQRQ